MRAVDDAKMVIGKALEIAGDGVVAVGLSGGKDSVAMCHLVAQQCTPLVIYNDSGLELPESRPVVDQLTRSLGLELHVAVGDALRIEEDGGDSDNAIIKPVKEALEENEVTLEFVGLRKLESKRRRMVINRHGPIYKSKRWGCHIAWPMRRWSAADVFAYIDEHGLPLHPAYLQCTDSTRDDVRVSWAYDSDRTRLGEVEILRRNNPAIFRELRDRGIIDAT